MPASPDPERRVSSSESEGPADDTAPAVYPHRHVETFDGTRRAHLGQVHDRACSSWVMCVHGEGPRAQLSTARLGTTLAPDLAELERASNMSPDSNDDRELCAEDDAACFQILPAGAAVIARRGHWRVDACVTHQDCSEIHVSGESGATVLLSPFDRFEPVEPEGRLRVARLRRWWSHVNGLAAGIHVGRLHVGPARARILAYQLAPALAVAAGCTGVLLADEVGLGKTVQAGWIVADTLGRHPDARALIAVPAGLRQQWRAELSTLLGIEAVVADARWLRHTVSALPADINPWSLPGTYIVSLDFVKRTDAVRSLEYQAWDLLVIDEAHAAAAPTDRHRALHVIACRSRCVVMISATPFSGDEHSLASIAGPGAGPGDPPPLMFRRSRAELDLPGVRRHRFGVVSITRPERRLQRLLERYSRLVWRDAPGDADAARLAMTVLRKRALSSPLAALNSLERRRRFLAGAERLPRQLALFDREEDPLDDEEPGEILAPPGMHDVDLERRWLAALIDAAASAARLDSKLAFLRRLVRRLRGDSAIVFTEYRDTLAHLSAYVSRRTPSARRVVRRRAGRGAPSIQRGRRPSDRD